jgi:hypothetical protein
MGLKLDTLAKQLQKRLLTLSFLSVCLSVRLTVLNSAIPTEKISL